LNTGVGTKEMIHRIFKNIAPRTNRKNIDLDLLKRYTTLFAIRHLFDGGVDGRFSSSNNALTNLPHHLKRLMNDWFIAEESFDLDINEDLNEGLISVIMIMQLMSNFRLIFFYPNYLYLNLSTNYTNWLFLC